MLMESNDDDYYELLGVDQTATPEEIRRAYRAIVGQPDRSTADYLALQECLRRAYAILSHPGRRARYDWQLDIARRRRGGRLSVRAYDENEKMAIDRAREKADQEESRAHARGCMLALISGVVGGIAAGARALGSAIPRGPL